MAEAARQASTERPVGYLASAYPAVSHTFIRREIAALRRRGLAIETFSIRRADPAALAQASDRVEAERTVSVLPVSARSLLRAHAEAMTREPRRYLATLGLAFRHRVPGLRPALWAVFHFVESILLAGQLRVKRVRHLHVHFANAGGTVGLLAAHFSGIPVSFTIHGSKADFDYPAAPLLAGKVAASRFVACVSHFARSQVMRMCPPDQWEKTVVVRCGIEPAALPGAHPTESALPRIVCVGRLVPEKAQIGLLEAMALLLERRVEAELVLVGDGPDRRLLDARARELGLEKSVRFAGSLPESEALRAIASGHVFAMASLIEGLPVVLMEALALQVPVVAPAISGIPELVENERTGLLYRPGDWADLARSLERLLREPEIGRALALRGRQRVLRQHDVDAAVEPLWERLRPAG